MPNRTRVVAHLELDALETRYRQAHDPVARSHFQIVWLLAQGKTRTDVASVTGYSERWIGEIVRRYNAQGPDALGDRRHDNPGGQTILKAQQQERLWEALHGPAPDGGLWTGPKVAAWIEAETGHLWVSPTGLDLSGAFWSALETSAATARQGRSRGTRCFPKRLSRAVDAVRAAHPGTSVEVWAQDEHRIGLKPVQRRVWLLPDSVTRSPGRRSSPVNVRARVAGRRQASPGYSQIFPSSVVSIFGSVSRAPSWEWPLFLALGIEVDAGT